MHLDIVAASIILNKNGLQEPQLALLSADIVNYKTLLLQADGHIEITGDGVKNRDSTRADIYYKNFLNLAVSNNTDLAITPEYSLPWHTLISSITAGSKPEVGKLWVLGCESIKYSELVALKQKLSPHAFLLFENLTPDNTRFLDPIVYVFVTNDNAQVEQLVLLVQFKTHPMGDPGHYEINGLQLGTQVYRFGGTTQKIRLISLICSDAFNFLDPHAQDIYYESLIIHIQLNQKPRHNDYRSYRDKLLSLAGECTEIICLNWATKSVVEHYNGQETPWTNTSGSAWYLKSPKFDCTDPTVHKNHKLGLYYTWLGTMQSHALFFNNAAATYLIEATKVIQVGAKAAVARRRGPQLTKIFLWNNSAWKEANSLDDGLAAIVATCGDAQTNISQIASSNVMAAERILAICEGKIDHAEWFKANHLDSVIIESNEVIKRLTFCQDMPVGEFRERRLMRCGNLWNILEDDAALPVVLEDFKDDFSLDWDATFPHQNAIAAKGRATVIYMGEDTPEDKVEQLRDRVTAYLRKSSRTEGEYLHARDRVIIWYRKNHQLKIHDLYRYVKINQTTTNNLDIGSE